MAYQFSPSGVCARRIIFDLQDGVLHNVRFEGGCSGNTQGVAALLEGVTAEEAVKRLKGIRCGMRATSCPDQLARAVEQALAET